MTRINLVGRDGEQRLIALVRSARHQLVISSPYVGRAGVELLLANIGPGLRDSGNILFLTDLSPLNVCQGATDLDALHLLSALSPRMHLAHLPKLHAKVYIADSNTAIVTSANLTIGGLRRNREYGVEIAGPRLVRRIRRDITEYAQLGARVSEGALIDYLRDTAILLKNFQPANRGTEELPGREIQSTIGQIEESLLRLRLAGGPITTVFAHTIEYLLRRLGPLTTVQLHPLIADLHPDLCDDSIDRVIDGKRFGKKWKHAVRSAQQQLKQRGRVTFDGVYWRHQ